MYILDAMNHKNKVMSSLENKYHIIVLWHIIIIFNKIRMAKNGRIGPYVQSGLKVYCFFVVESKIFQCKVENLKKRKNSGFPLAALRLPGPCHNFFDFFNFQLCIERFLFVVLEGYTSLQSLQIASSSLICLLSRRHINII